MKSKHREVIYQTRGKMFYGTCKDRKVIYKTRDGVFYLIPNTEMSYIKHEKEFLFYVQKLEKCHMKDSLQCTISRLNLRPKLE